MTDVFAMSELGEVELGSPIDRMDNVRLSVVVRLDPAEVPFNYSFRSGNAARTVSMRASDGMQLRGDLQGMTCVPACLYCITF